MLFFSLSHTQTASHSHSHSLSLSLTHTGSKGGGPAVAPPLAPKNYSLPVKLEAATKEVPTMIYTQNLGKCQVIYYKMSVILIE